MAKKPTARKSKKVVDSAPLSSPLVTRAIADAVAHAELEAEANIARPGVSLSAADVIKAREQGRALAVAEIKRQLGGL